MHTVEHTFEHTFEQKNNPSKKQFAANMEIVRLRCEQLPGVSVLGVGTGSSKIYLVHAHQFVGLLKGRMERTGVYRAFNAFLNSAVGAVLKGSDGGELASAVRNGVLDRAMYSHCSHKYGSGGLSRFVTLDGAKELLEKLPGANAAVKSRLKDVFDSVSASFLSFSQATAEQCAKDDEEEVIEEIFDNSGFHGSFAVSNFARTVQLKECQVQELKLQQIKITRDKATQTDLVLSSTPGDMVSANACTALILVPSDFSSEHPDFEKLVDKLSCNVGWCDEEPSASCLSLVVCGQVGYVYAAWNPLFPDLIKIGATMRAFPYIRVQELSSCAGVPEPFQLLASIPTPDPFALERAIHAFYASVRKYGRKKEFFLLAREDVVYHFHVRSLEAMGSGVSSSVGKVKKRKASEAGGHERKHTKHFDTQEAEKTFKDNLMSFLKTRVRVSDKAFLSTKNIQKSFAECASRMPSNQLFSKTLRGQIRILFPAAVTGLWKESRGYYGITFEQITE